MRRGTDIFKALALGAKAVGLSRPALYAMSAFGQPGIEKMIRILKDELEMTMRLMGTPTIADIREDMVVTSDLGRHNTIPRDWLQQETYLPKATQASTQKFRGRRTENARTENFVQSGHDALASGEVASLRREVRELKDMVAGLAQVATNQAKAAATPSPFGLGTFGVLLLNVLLGLAGTIFVLDSRMSVHRTALVLIAYLVVHLSGNLLLFSGAEQYNSYANTLSSAFLVKIVEYYLLLATVLHVGMALYRAYKTKVLKGVTKAPVSVFKRLYLMLSGLTILAFIVVHLQHFRFNPVVVEATGAGGNVDFYGLVHSTLADQSVALGYIVAVVVIGVHLYLGWTKAVTKMHLDAAHGSAKCVCDCC